MNIYHAVRKILGRGALALPFAVAACAGLEPVPVPEPQRQLTVDRIDYRHSVYFETDVDRPSAAERQRLAAFLEGLDPQRRATFRLSGHADDRASESYNLALSARRARGIGQIIRDWGFDGEIATSAFGEKATARADRPAAALARNRRVDIGVEGWIVQLPDCPDWSREPAHNSLNLPLGNLGCATLSNLGQMVADPADLQRGRALGPADATREAEAVVRYRTDKIKELQEGLAAP